MNTIKTKQNKNKIKQGFNKIYIMQLPQKRIVNLSVSEQRIKDLVH